MNNDVNKGDIIVLIDSSYRRFIIDTNGKTDKIKGVGVIDPSSLVGDTYGSQLEIGNKQFWVLPVSLQDKLKGLKRKAQIILPKDAAHIILNCSIESGQTVLKQE